MKEPTAHLPSRTRATRRRGPKLPALIVLVTVALTIALVYWYGHAPPPAVGPEEQSDSSTPAPNASYGALEGRWLRTDGDYILEIRRIDGDGRAEAAYYNPRPIHVARAEAVRDGGTLKLTVVLDDIGYPGSQYHLQYAAADRTLLGQYYQAALNETFEVIFVRIP